MKCIKFNLDMLYKHGLSRGSTPMYAANYTNTVRQCAISQGWRITPHNEIIIPVEEWPDPSIFKDDNE